MASHVQKGTVQPIGSIAIYLAAHFSKSMLWHSSILLFAFYLTEICGLNPRLAGVLLGGSLALNGVVDLSIGIVKDRSISTAASAARFQQPGAIVAAASFALFCSASMLTDGYRVALAIGALLIFRMSYSIVDVSQNALLSLGEQVGTDRFELVAWRAMTSALAILAVATIVAPALVIDQDLAPMRFAVTGTVLAILLVTCSSLLEHNMGQRTVPAPTKPRHEDATEIAFIVALLMIALTSFSNSVFGKLEAYYAAYGDATPGASLTLMIAVAIGNLVSQPLWLACWRRLGTAKTLVVSAMMTIGAAACFLLSANPVTVFPVGLLFGAGAGGSGLALWGIVATVGTRSRPMLRFGVFTCFSKLSQGAGAVLLGQMLGQVDYRHVMNMPGNFLLRAMTFVPIAASVACIFLALKTRRQLK